MATAMAAVGGQVSCLQERGSYCVTQAVMDGPTHVHVGSTNWTQ